MRETLSLSVPKTARGCGKPFFLQSLERGRRSSPAVILAVAEMYIKGVSTHDAEAVIKEISIEGLVSTQVSRAKKCWMISCSPSATDPRAKYAI